MTLHGLELDDPRAEKSAAELDVVDTACQELGDHEVVWLETPPGDATGVLILERHEPTAPPVWQPSGPFADAVRVHPGALVKG